MRLLNKYCLPLVFLFSLGSCRYDSNLLTPLNDNHNTINRTYTDPLFAEGLLIYGYTKLPTNNYSFNDVATDNAVTNNMVDSYHRVATGEWTGLYNPFSQWDNCLMGIQSVNQFLTVVDTVPWNTVTPELNSLFKIRFKGESYGLIGILEYHLLQTVGGIGTDGNLLGIPLYDKFINATDNLNVPRATFTESVNKIYADFDQSLQYLTMNDYGNITDASQLPPGLTGYSMVSYNSIFGDAYKQRLSGRIVKAYKARVALLAASPAFNNGDVTLWQTAANYAAASLNDIGGITGLDPNGHKWYDQLRTDAVNIGGSPTRDQKEMIWRTTTTLSNDREADNFPPSLFGKGNINPTQNLVDAFPMKNGYPISNPLSKYDASAPYSTRDPRLELYIAYNGSTMKGTTIKTGIGGGMNAKDSLNISTRTGYYLRKLLREDVNMDPAASTTKKHYEVHMRYTEMFLIYAEAANEAYGPDGMAPGVSFSARNVMRAIRKRAGITQADQYLNSINSQEEMRNLIHNERRLELCFEGDRFWDLRRWKTDLTEPAKGVNINNASTSFSVVEVEPRRYNDYMIYGPLPENEILKYNALLQNRGW
jgi:hypothetical protein